LISACGIFCVGCGLSVHHGISGLFHPHEASQLIQFVKVPKMKI